VEEAHKWASLYTRGVATTRVKQKLEELYPTATFTLVEYTLSPEAPIQAAFADLYPRLRPGYAYYFANYWPANAHASILYLDPDGILTILDPQTKQELPGIDAIIAHLQSIGTYKLEILVPTTELLPRVNIKQSIQQLRIKKLLYNASLHNGVEAPRAMSYARNGISVALQEKTEIKFIKAADLLTPPYAILLQKLRDLHQHCLGTEIGDLSAYPNSFVVFGQKEVGDHTILAAMMIVIFVPADSTVELWSVCTDYAFRKQGIFKKMLQAFDLTIPAEITRYRLFCETQLKGLTTFQDRFIVYSKLGFQLPIGTVVNCSISLGGLNIQRTGTIIGSEQDSYLVQFGSDTIQIPYTQILGIVHSDFMTGTSVLMEAERNVVQQHLAPPVALEPGGGAGVGVGPDGAMPEEEYKGGTRKTRRGKKRKHTRRR